MPSLLNHAASITPQLAAYIEGVAEAPLHFDGSDPLHHSRQNHMHLWMVEYLADDHPRINLAFRRAVVIYIFQRWKARLRTYAPYYQAGYRLYLYEDMAPTVSVVAQTAQGFPYDGQPRIVPSIDDVLRVYEHRSWRAQWQAPALTPARLLTAIDHVHGSISTPVAQALGLTAATLRRWIAWFDLADQVNALRKRYHRRPAQFTSLEALPHRYRIWEEQLPAYY